MLSLGFVINCKFLDLYVSHVRQSDNKLVYILAQNVKGISSFLTWVEEGPIVIDLALVQKVLNLSSS